MPARGHFRKPVFTQDTFAGHKAVVILARLAVLLCLMGFADRCLAGNSADAVSREVIEKLQRATVRVINGNDSSSGVIVSSRGLILTVAHGLPAGILPTQGTSQPVAQPRVRVVLSDQTAWTADVLLTDADLDLGVIRLQTLERPLPEKLPVVLLKTAPATEQSPSEPPRPERQLSNGVQWVLAFGYPGREQGRLPALPRLGKILNKDQPLVQTTCLLTAGDSGGPLVELNGELIGLHQRIGIDASKNLHLDLTSSRVLQRLQSWQMEIAEQRTRVQTESGRVEDSGLFDVPAAGEMPAEVRRRSERRLASVYRRTSALDAAPPVLGTRLSESLIVTKLSELKGETRFQVRLGSDRVSREAQLIAQRQPWDLALLSVEGADVVESELDELRGVDVVEGHLVFPPGGDRMGMICRVNHTESTGRSQYGATIEDRTGQVPVVLSVAAGGTAQRSGVEPGDGIKSISITGEPISDLNKVEDLGVIFSRAEPGDNLTTRILRAGVIRELPGVLQHDPAGEFQRTEFLDGRSGRLSERRTGFKGVLQHDIPILPEQCGSPLLDSAGRVVGINIARRSRESSLAIPIQAVLDFAMTVKQAADEQ